MYKEQEANSVNTYVTLCIRLVVDFYLSASGGLRT
jgi:hypothetical protein